MHDGFFFKATTNKQTKKNPGHTLVESGELGPGAWILDVRECSCSIGCEGRHGRGCFHWLHAEWVEQKRGFETAVSSKTGTPPSGEEEDEEVRSHIPSCASAAVLVVGAAGLVCCRPTIGQRGGQSGYGTCERPREQKPTEKLNLSCVLYGLH